MLTLILLLSLLGIVLATVHTLSTYTPEFTLTGIGRAYTQYLAWVPTEINELERLTDAGEWWISVATPEYRTTHAYYVDCHWQSYRLAKLDALKTNLYNQRYYTLA
jgi:hypothetical protein